MAYISIQPSDFFNTVLYNGTGSSQAITGVGFAPDFTWIKNRPSNYTWRQYDTVRGATKHLCSQTDDPSTTDANGLSVFGADGFTVVSTDETNRSGGDGYVSYNWGMGTTSGIATNGSTTITPSTYTFSQAAGMSAISYTGNATSGAKVAHGLGATPSMIIVKNSEDSGGYNWQVYHTGLPSPAQNRYLKLNDNGTYLSATSRWNDTAPDSVNFTVGNSATVNQSGNSHMAYCFTPIKGFSSFGKYTGNGNADGTFVYTGFRPAFVCLKMSEATRNWFCWDNKRNTYNVVTSYLRPDVVNLEISNVNFVDFLSNGFKWRVSDDDANKDNTDYVYMAFAEFPFVSSNSKAGTAR